MTPAQHQVLACLQGHAFNMPTCCPSLHLIAHQTGLSRRHAQRCLNALRDQGLLTWTHERRPGRRWHHNQYTLTHWSPPLRRTALASIDRFKAAKQLRGHARNGGCPTERTAGPRRDESIVEGPSNANASSELQTFRSTKSYVAETISSNEADQPACEGCQQRDHRIRGLHEAVRDAEERAAEKLEELTATQAQLVRAGRVEVALRNELSKEREEHPDSDDIRELMHLWRDVCKAGNKRHVLRVSDPRGQRTAWALKRYGKQRVHDAIMGATLDNWAMGRDPRAHGRQFNDLAKHILKDNETVERFELAWVRRNKPAPLPVASDRSWPHPFPRILELLEHVKQTDAGSWTARCPGHEDRHASLSVAEGEKGAVLHCHAGCNESQIAGGLGVPVAEWFYPPDVPRPAVRRVTVAPDPLPSEQELVAWHQRLMRSDRTLDKLLATRGWSRQAITRLRIGWDGERFSLPVYDQHGELVTVARYMPTRKPKMLALSGRDRGLFPAPESVDGRELWLVEGEPDAVAAQSLGLPAVGVPGVGKWDDSWVDRMGERRIVVCLDCDKQGREAALRIANRLTRVAWEVRVMDLSPTRSDGFDLTDFVVGGGSVSELRSRAAGVPPMFQQPGSMGRAA